jgi:hypothetical protein
VTATGPRLSAGLKALDQRPSTGAIERYFYFSCCLLAALGDRAAKGGVARRIGPQTALAFANSNPAQLFQPDARERLSGRSVAQLARLTE